MVMCYAFYALGFRFECSNLTFLTLVLFFFLSIFLLFFFFTFFRRTFYVHELVLG